MDTIERTSRDLERFLSHVDPGDCWMWLGATSKGYGRFWADGALRTAHLWLFRTLVGPLPEGLELDHLCRNTACVNPDHLEPVTRRENMRRSPTYPYNLPNNRMAVA